MKSCFYRGLCFVQLEETDKIEQRKLELDKDYEIGHIFKKIGTKERTSLDTGYSFTYRGICEGYVLFEPILENEKKDNQLLLFEVEQQPVTYLAPLYVNREILLMQSSENGFWDIKI